LNLDNYSKENLWHLLVEAIHATVMYPKHKAYTRDTLLIEKPDITPKELAQQLSMSLGEALVILDELINEQKTSS
jgi:hypothetical protein